MSTSEFVIDLGGGLFMDHTGALVKGPAPKKPIYTLPGGPLPIKPKSLKKSFESIGSELLKAKKDPKLHQKLVDLGVPDEMIELLGEVGKIAGVLAKVAGAAAFAVDIAYMLNIFKTGPDPLLAKIEEHFKHLEDLVRAGQNQEKLRDITEHRSKLKKALEQVAEYIEELRYPVPRDLSRMRQEMNDQLDDAHEGLHNLLAESMWIASFDKDAYQAVWPWIYNPHTFPPGEDPKPAHIDRQSEQRFDHRLLMINVPYAIAAYLNLIKALVPEYRTTSDFSEFLESFARGVDALAVKMRQDTLARTLYRPTDFGHTLSGDQIIDTFFMSPVLDPDWSNWPVGALDLCMQTNYNLIKLQEDNMALPLASGGVPIALHYHPTMNLRWTPPARLEVIEQPFGLEQVYRITNLEECAVAANDAAEQHFADLLLSSGYLNLVQTAALLRHLVSEPDHSETVSGDSRSWRQAQTPAPITVQSENIPLTGVIEAAAQLEKQELRASTTIYTQSLERERPLKYRVLLRTLRSAPYREAGYEEFYQTDYVEDPQKPGFRQLRVATGGGMLLDEVELIIGPTPDERRVQELEFELTASTFDWYIPVESTIFDEYQLVDDGALERVRQANYLRLISQGLRKERPESETNFVKAMPAWASATVDRIQRESLSLADLFGEQGSQTWDGEKRHRREENVFLSGKLTWDGPELVVRLDGSPSDRNFVAYLVVEELFYNSQQWLHTVFPLQFNNQLTFVPESFFTDEAKAKEKARTVLADFNRRYRAVVDIGPEDPIIRLTNPASLVEATGLHRLLAAADTHRPDLLAQALKTVG